MTNVRNNCSHRLAIIFLLCLLITARNTPSRLKSRHVYWEYCSFLAVHEFLPKKIKCFDLGISTYKTSFHKSSGFVRVATGTRAKPVKPFYCY